MFFAPTINLSVISQNVSKTNTFFIMLDMDGTLKSAENDGGSLSFKLDGKTYAFDPRPGVKEFVQDLVRIAPVHIFTASSPKYAKECLRLLGIRGYQSLITRQNMLTGGFPKCESFALIDDDPVIAELKISCVNRFTRSSFVVGRNCWHVWIPSYKHGKESPDILKDIVEKTRDVANKSL